MGTIVLILANSVKHQNHCVAGKVIKTKRWIRIVSDVSGKELSHDQVLYKNPYGRFPVKALQKIKIKLGDSAPLIHQPENVIRSDCRWKQRYRIKENELCNYVDNPKSIWGQGAALSAFDIENGLVEIKQSLYLVRVENMNFYMSDRQKNRVSFLYNRIEYDLPVTDPNFRRYSNEKANRHGFLCISLGENFQGFHYKIVATIFLGN
jgi:hypothetical protein